MAGSCLRLGIPLVLMLALLGSLAVAELTVRPTAFNCNASIQGPPIVASPDGSTLFVNNNGETALNATTLKVDYSNADSNVGWPFVVVSASKGWSVYNRGSIFHPAGQALYKARQAVHHYHTRLLRARMRLLIASGCVIFLPRWTFRLFRPPLLPGVLLK